MNLSASKVLSAAVVTGALVCTMVATAFAAELSSGVGTVTASALKLRAEASTTSACLTLLPKGTSVVVEDDSIAGWYKVNHEGVTGYLSSEYVSFSISGSAKLGNGKVTGNDVNVRSAASTSASRLGSLNKGDVVAVTGIDNGWYKISTNGVTGYVSSDYMVTCKDSAGSRGDGATAVATASSSSLGQQVVDYAKQYLGCPYVYGGNGPSSFDCSGYTSYVYRHFGYTLNRTASTQLSNGTSVSKSELQPGDLVFFKYNTSKAASHVGIYIGGGQFIHASTNTYTVKIDDLTRGHYANVYVGARRIL